MTTRKVVVDGPTVTAKQMRTFFSLPVTEASFQEYLDAQDPSKNKMDTKSQLESWRVLLENVFGIVIDIESIAVPARQEGYDRLIVVPQGLTFKEILRFYRKKFGTVSCYSDGLSDSDDLDKLVGKYGRTNKRKSYAVWVSDSLEVDGLYRGVSASQLSRKKVLGITLMECLLRGIKCFYEKRKTSNGTQNVTLCSGSRYKGGGVPSVSLHIGRRKSSHELSIKCADPSPKRKPQHLSTRVVVAK